MSSLLASSSALAAPQIVFVVLIACIVLLCARAWGSAFNFALTRRVSLLLDGSIVLMLLLFLLLVIVRFRTFA